ncbi:MULTISPECIES: oxygen-independent coproporphyrinogen III oxidase [unclassified Rhodanobacter]|uniref:oxygen-independent coproporphyrinogen III oxidase n=1 Tax=unclassified Rhodanobacter TaxID=2621553 RepID=UPI000986F353|nr:MULTISPECIES: oxygen-independent coproporphyrinogen III oxidase [unclassified Rhodanobacter]OOG38539.1 oxygen-independent coproporphyrinogen III oxidase [Rhodanobacter sp. C05]OOG50123.1 oxygen-independent coproporphyrinogen III oxidase [Rhodanobacter sp. C01]OOG52309.1 oxygen-independent coproporphyrinogen III oxidase [Rhodanobacter sp. C03]OOG65958.1 oxygen-independent coproporphyrinogen III oxidase [Rhodanobacter sp. B04]
MSRAITAPEFDPATIARYDTDGPRYTSYPTAPQFRRDFVEATLREVIRASNEEPIPRSLSLYVHVPFCLSPCFYCGCNRVITRDIGKADRYLERLYREIELLAPLFDRDRPVRQLHFGGGTPNFLDLPRMAELMESLAQHFSFIHESRREYGIEIDPRFADGNYIHGLAELGFNRLSVGIQDFDPEVQQAVNRIQSVEQTREVLQAGRAAGFVSASVDLIYGLPRQTMQGFDHTLSEVIGLEPDRVAVYGYAHMPHLFKAQQQIDTAELPDPATRLALFGQALQRLCSAGYVYVGMDHFARPDDELVRAQRAGTLQRNFQGYSTHGDCDIVGLGVSAISRIGNSYSQNARDLTGYYSALDNARLPIVRGLLLDEDDEIRREAISELMCHGKLDMYAFGARHRLIFGEYFATELARLQLLADDQLVTLDSRIIRVTSRGQLLLRSIAMCFDAYLGRESTARYSRTI